MIPLLSWYTAAALHSLLTVIDSEVGVLGHLGSQNDAIMSWLRLTAISNCFPHPYWTCKGFEYIDMLSIGIQQQPYTVYPQYRLIFWGSGSLVESTWCHYIMVETDSHLKLLPTSILDIYNMFEHIDMLSTGIQQQPYTVIPTLLGSDFGVLGHLWSQNDVITSRLRLTATSNCIPHPHYTYTKCLRTLIGCPSA